MSRTGHNAQAAASQFAAEYATTDFQEILNDRDIDLVVIATRHDLHTAMALQALQAGKHVLVEKPLALNRQELTLITDYFAQAGGLASSMTTGFNRRFSPCARGVHEVVAKRGNPMVINYSMNAGYLALDHWVHTAEGGGRNVGEACHIYDLFTYLTGSKLKTVTAHSITPATGYYSPRDNFVATITFEDGSVATLTYTAMGSVAYPKENMVIHCDGKTIVMDDYKKLSGYGVELRALNSRVSEKGQKEEIAAVAQVIKNGGEWPIPLWQQVQAMEIAFAVEAELGGNC